MYPKKSTDNISPIMMNTEKAEKKPVPKIETEVKSAMPKSRGSKTKAAIGSAGSAVGRGTGAITSGIGRGASSVMGLFGRGSKEEKPKSRKTTTDTDYSSMKLPELRDALKKKGLPTSGNKAALIKRLKK